MSAEPAEIETEDDDDAPPPTRRKSAVVKGLEDSIRTSYRPDLYRCKACSVTVPDRDRAAHLAERCSKRAELPAGIAIEDAFEKRERPSVEDQARKAIGRQMKKGRRRRGRIEHVHRLGQELEAEAFTPDPEFAEEPLFPPAEPAPKRTRKQPETKSLMEQVGEIFGHPVVAPPPPKEKHMSNATMTTPEVAALLGVSAAGVRTWIARKLLTPVTKGGPGVAATFDRADVIALKVARATGEQPKAKPERKQKPKAALQKVARPAPVKQDLDELADDLRALMRIVDRGWLDEAQAFGIVRQAVGL